ncbi:hypothetical protein TMSI_07340 [Klebsiella quasipneumoniae]|jgi:hypothetical protein|nr:hypothetical protein TMSI_07340 [Klebsiella quasipneumoniae]
MEHAVINIETIQTTNTFFLNMLSSLKIIYNPINVAISSHAEVAHFFNNPYDTRVIRTKKQRSVKQEKTEI